MQPLNADELSDRVDFTLYDRHASTIFAYLYQQMSSPQDAEDLLLEVFIAALNCDNLAGLTSEEQLAWLRRVARNKVIDRHRHASRLTMIPLEQAIETEDGEPTPEQQAVQQENYEYLHQALEQLSTIQQQIVRLRYGNGLRLVEIAGILKKSEGTVRKMLARTLRHLRTIYEQNGRRTS